MIFTETQVPGVFVIDLERIEDSRGFFARAWSREEFGARGLSTSIAQCNLSYNHKKGTLRGMHYQSPPHTEVKLVRCTRGSLFDVVVDLRPDSVTYKQWISVELSETNRKAIYVPAGCAHGFQTLEDETETFYQMSTPHTPGAERGVRWDDPAFGISWPEVDRRILSEKDAGWPDFG